MDKEDGKKMWKKHAYKVYGGSGHIYGLGFLGALVYFLQHSSTFTDGVIGVLKAIVWPGMIVYKFLELLHL